MDKHLELLRHSPLGEVLDDEQLDIAATNLGMLETVVARPSVAEYTRIWAESRHFMDRAGLNELPDLRDIQSFFSDTATSNPARLVYSQNMGAIILASNVYKHKTGSNPTPYDTFYDMPAEEIDHLSRIITGSFKRGGKEVLKNLHSMEWLNRRTRLYIQTELVSELLITSVAELWRRELEGMPPETVNGIFKDKCQQIKEGHKRFQPESADNTDKAVAAMFNLMHYAYHLPQQSDFATNTLVRLMPFYNTGPAKATWRYHTKKTIGDAPDFNPNGYAAVLEQLAELGCDMTRIRQNTPARINNKAGAELPIPSGQVAIDTPDAILQAELAAAQLLMVTHARKLIDAIAGGTIAIADIFELYGKAMSPAHEPIEEIFSQVETVEEERTRRRKVVELDWTIADRHERQNRRHHRSGSGQPEEVEPADPDAHYDQEREDFLWDLIDVFDATKKPGHPQSYMAWTKPKGKSEKNRWCLAVLVQTDDDGNVVGEHVVGDNPNAGAAHDRHAMFALRSEQGDWNEVFKDRHKSDFTALGVRRIMHSGDLLGKIFEYLERDPSLLDVQRPIRRKVGRGAVGTVIEEPAPAE